MATYFVILAATSHHARHLLRRRARREKTGVSPKHPLWGPTGMFQDGNKHLRRQRDVNQFGKLIASWKRTGPF